LNCILKTLWNGVDWIHLAQDKDQWWALVNTVMAFLVPRKAGNSLTRWATVSFPRRTVFYAVSTYDALSWQISALPWRLVSLFVTGTKQIPRRGQAPKQRPINAELAPVLM
jgi:hypothetical protein